MEDDGLKKESGKIINGPNKNKYLVAIHLGAGDHSESKLEKYKWLCEDACGKAKKILKEGGSADDAVVAATIILENSDLCNAGYGSSLNLQGKVECDAAFMNGNGYFGAVGCSNSVYNPILVAKKIAELQENRTNTRKIPPNFLVGPGVKEFALSEGMSICKEEDLISKRATKYFKEHENDLIVKTDEIGDTIGVVALDKNGNVASSVSSGGIWYKNPGRIGHSPIFGCGCWASKRDKKSSIAISCSGVGELLSKVRLPHACASVLQKESYDNPMDALRSTITKQYLKSHLIKNDCPEIERTVGLLCLEWNGRSGELYCVHSSHKFIVAFMGPKDKNTNVIFSKLNSNASEENIRIDSIIF